MIGEGRDGVGVRTVVQDQEVDVGERELPGSSVAP